MTRPKRCLYWFRTDLRLHDNPGLLKLLELNPTEFYPVWCWDPNYVYKTSVGQNRWQFLLDSMNDLSDSITRLNDRSKLLVIRGDPQIILPYVWKKWSITHFGFELDDDNRYAQPRDRSILELAQKHNIQSITTSGHTLYCQDLLLESNKGELPKTYQSFMKLIERVGHPEQALEPPSKIPNPGSTSFDDPLPESLLKALKNSLEDQQSPTQDLNKKLRVKPDTVYESFLAGPNGNFDVPTMEEMGMDRATSTHRGGETLALKILENYLKDKQRTITFEKPKTSPAEFNPASTTVLSPHLKFGTLSPRLFYHRLIDLQNSNPKIKASQPPESLTGQLFWREFFHLQQSQIKNFHQIDGNPICRFFNWRLRDKINEDVQDDERDDDEKEAKRLFVAWRDGMTGYPWIDAIMRQLKSEGWIHHLARHSVACFLTRGNLYISWERGAEVFDELLIDWDPSLNAANWMWLSASAYFQQYFRVYSPVQFGKKYDEQSVKYIKEYCKELKNFPKKYIYQPWEAPIEVQEQSNCIIGKDYPKPIVDEKKSKEECIEKMKAGFKLGVFGNHTLEKKEKVLSKVSNSKDLNDRDDEDRIVENRNKKIIEGDDKVESKKHEYNYDKRRNDQNKSKKIKKT
ncbi:FAD binding domain of DNA photolyase-domain-containing protein [Phakopsora pachyrhizi]|uniref:FAD binding domain of DNA photolyase-domain-containing protein n=1 Tax=Phakopsora pachyrhizi TaxID=170000 RepID=A0AAV0BPN5_PHAPC|nr:FAD binding domain of DNA photolyase-domain-containing protein [Phakopsora pachyrhizi]CAH7689313.1 FAD binding domain of DNA photolyase-domain-containing protein [Phakopsora pachyrhizi]